MVGEPHPSKQGLKLFSLQNKKAPASYPPGEPILTPGEGQGNFETFPAPAFVEISWN